MDLVSYTRRDTREIISTVIFEKTKYFHIGYLECSLQRRSISWLNIERYSTMMRAKRVLVYDAEKTPALGASAGVRKSQIIKVTAV